MQQAVSAGRNGHSSTFLSLMGALVSIIWQAVCRPTRRGRRCVPPKPGRMPSCSSGRPSFVPAPRHFCAPHSQCSLPPLTCRPPQLCILLLRVHMAHAHGRDMKDAQPAGVPEESSNCFYVWTGSRRAGVQQGRTPGVQRRALQASATSRPPPSASESTAATVGLGPLSSSAQKLSLILRSPCTAQCSSLGPAHPAARRSCQ